MTDWKAIRFKRGSVVHVTGDYRVTGCGRPADGSILVSHDPRPTCQRCARAMLDELN